MNTGLVEESRKATALVRNEREQESVDAPNAFLIPLTRTDLQSEEGVACGSCGPSSVDPMANTREEPRESEETAGAEQNLHSNAPVCKNLLATGRSSSKHSKLYWDSCAGGSLCPYEWSHGQKLTKPSGYTYTAATGDEVRPIGKMNMSFKDSATSRMLQHEFEVSDRPLHPDAGIVSFGDVTSRGRRVVLDDDPEVGNYVLNKETGEKLFFDKVNNVYVSEIDLEPACTDDENRNLLPLQIGIDEETTQTVKEQVEPEIRAKSLPIPYKPSTAEVDEHQITGHAQYRAWCSRCVRGAGRAAGHYKSEGAELPKT